MEVGTLKELGVEVGDVVERISWPDGGYEWVGHKYLIERIMGSIKACNQNEIGSTASIESDPGEFRIISRANPKPKLWRDMTPEEKGALLLAAHEGKVIEYLYVPQKSWYHAPRGQFCDNYAYRIKPQPKIETVELYGRPDVQWVMASCKYDTHRITFQTINGTPDCATIKMESI